MEILLVIAGSIVGAGVMYMYLDLKDTFRTSRIKEETIVGVEKNDRLYRELRKFCKKIDRESFEKIKNSL